MICKNCGETVRKCSRLDKFGTCMFSGYVHVESESHYCYWGNNTEAEVD